MTSFVGWAPTVMGRLSFSRVGDEHRREREVCNHTATLNGGGFLLACERRASRDNPLPEFLMRWLGRWREVQYLAFLRVGPAELPRTTNPAPKEDEAAPPVVVEHDQEGALHGHVLLLSIGPTYQKNASWKARVDSILQLARDGRCPSCSHEERLKLFDNAEQLGVDLYEDLKATFAEGAPTPGFGLVQVTLLRSGQCNLEAESSTLFTTKEMKDAQRLAASEGVPRIAAAEGSAARQVFFFIRDLAHRHYHHEPHSDLLTTTYEWSAGDDETWRRETQYGLARLAIAARRRDTAESYKRSLGLVAYAEAFQKNLCGWSISADGKPVRSNWRFAYDFAALRQSIDASLKVRELKDSQRRQRMIFVFGFLVTCLGIIVAGTRSAPDGSVAPAKPILDYLVEHPIRSLFAAGVGSYAFDVAATQLSTQPSFVWTWIGGFSRFIEAIMGSAMVAEGNRWVSYLLGWLLMFLAVAAAVVLSSIAYWFAFRALASGGVQ